MNIQDRRKTLTVEELRRRYNLDALDKDRKAIKLQKEQLTKVDAELNNFVEITTKNLKELQNQVDGNITTWFFNGVPTIETEPAIHWTTDTDKNNHLGDLYYDQETGYAYRWAYENNAYTWSKIVDADVVEALAVANAAQDTADSKRRVFVVQPIPPYDIGDIWIKEDTDLYRCRASRSEGNFNIADWIRATNYTDDTVALGTKAELDQFKTQVTENYVSNATLETTVNSITGKVEETYTYVTTIENQVNDITTTTQTSTGKNNLHITDSLESNALEYHVEGKSEQDGEPTPDAPVEIKTIPSIRNLFNKDILLTRFTDINVTSLETGVRVTSTKTTQHCSGIYVIRDLTGLEGKRITASCYAKSSSKNEGFIFLRAGDNNGSGGTTYLSAETLDGRLEVSFIVPDNLTDSNKYLALAVYGTRETKPSVGDYVDYTNLTVNISDKYEPYVPYGAWAKVKVTGKNLFDKDNYKYVPYANIDSTGLIISAGKEDYRCIYIKVKPNTVYTFSANASKSWVISTTTELPVVGVQGTSIIIAEGTSYTLTTGNNTKYLVLRQDNLSGRDIQYYEEADLQIEENSIQTKYEAYKEKEVLIDLSKPNLFDKNIQPLAFIDAIEEKTNTGVRITSTANGVSGAAYGVRYITFDISDKLGKTYTISSSIICSDNNNGRFLIQLSDVNGENRTTLAYKEKLTTGKNSLSFTLPTSISGTSKYLAVFLNSNSGNSTSVIGDYVEYNDLKIFEGYTDYYELSSIGDTKDELNIIDGQVVIDKKIGKVVLNGSEGWSYDGNKFSFNDSNNVAKSFGNLVIKPPVYISHYILNSWNDYVNENYNACVLCYGWTYTAFRIRDDRFTTVDEFKTGLSENNTTVYYILATPQQITLPNTQIPLFEGVNHITLVDDLETTTSIKYYRNTPIAQDYVVQQQLDETNSNLSTTTDKTNQNASDINATNTNLNNNYYNKDQIDVMNTSTQEIVTQIKNQVETTTTATNLQISILQEQLTNGVTAVRTETGYTFDKDGLKIQKSGSEMSSLLDNDGLVVKRNETEVLTVRSSGVETENLTVRTHFIIGDNTRVENYKGGTGFFYIGGAN